MTQKTWTAVEVSAYLDGELEPEHQEAFTADLAEDTALRQRVEEMRQVVSLVRATPLREPPRNYMLTPSMVAEIQVEPERTQRRKPLLVMRLATSFVALLFVITFGLTVYQQAVLPGTVAQQGEQPEETLLLGEGFASEPTPEAVVETVVVEERAEIEKAVEEPVPPREGTIPPEEEMALASAPEASDVEGSTSPEAEGTPVGIAQVKSLEASPPTAEGEGEDFGAAEEELGRYEEEAVEGEVIAPLEDSVGPLEALRTGRTRLPIWLPIGLGIATAVMVAVTFWLSRRRLG